MTTPQTQELCCSNIKSSLLFYTEILGFNIQYQREEEKFAMLERQGARLMLEEIYNEPLSRTYRTWIAPRSAFL